MSLATWTLQRASKVLVVGTSLNAPDSPYQMFRVLQALADANYGGGTPSYNGSATFPAAGFGRPTWTSKAVSGRTIQQVADAMAADLAEQEYTHIFADLGTNDTVVARGATQAAIADFITETAGLPTLVAGCYARGEKWPSGTNDMVGANDTRLDETDTDLTTLLAVPSNIRCVSMRTTLYASLAPGPGATIGPYTIDGIHFRPNGNVAVTDLLLPYVSFT